MNLQYRIDLLCRLGEYILANNEDWQLAKEQAERENGWFIKEFIDLASTNIANCFLKKDLLQTWIAETPADELVEKPHSVGIIMAGNIPLVGFHDFLCVFVSGHKAIIKASSKDQVLIKHLVAKLIEWEPAVSYFVLFLEMLKGCDAYIATGSNNSYRYFEYYFGKFPHIIRRNRTSVALLSGNETTDELRSLADDVHQYFGLGCRNVTKIYVPEGYDFVAIINAFGKYSHLADHNKLKNNFDYNLALHILNKKYYMTNGCMLLIEDTAIFSPISQLNYEFYSDITAVEKSLLNHPDIQCITGTLTVPFGASQIPSLTDYADGVNTLAFLNQL
jgi:hypothetical protein